MFTRDYFICDLCLCFYDSVEMCNIDDCDNDSDCDNESDNNSDYSYSSNSKCFYKVYECNSTICEDCYNKYNHLKSCPVCIRDNLMNEYINNFDE